MKKMLFCAAAAIAALASCSKTQVVYNDAPEEIAFKQITGAMTKATDGYEALDGSISLGVYAYHTPVSGDYDSYFANVAFAKDGDAWAANPAEYYPLSGTLDFVGYAPYIPSGVTYTLSKTGAVSGEDGTITETLGTLTIYNFDNTDNNCELVTEEQVVDAGEGEEEGEGAPKVQRDLLYSDYIAGVGKKTGLQLMNLNHALAKIGVSVTLQGTGSLTIESLVLKNTYQTGQLNVTYSSETKEIAKQDDVTATSETVTTYIGTPGWSSGLTNTTTWPTYNYSIIFEESDKTLSLSSEDTKTVNSKEFYVIPGYQTTMELKYKLGDYTTVITHTFNLSSSSANIQWKAGNKYTYNITINNYEIKFDAKVAPWTNNTYSTEVDYANNTTTPVEE